MTIILQKNTASAGIFLVQIRITWRAFSKKSFSFTAFHLCNLLTRGRKELPVQTLPQKYKDIYLLGRTEIQKSKRQNRDSEVVHPNLPCFFLLGTLSSQHTRDLSQLLWFSHPFWFSFSCFYSSQFSLFHLSSITYVLQAKLPFPIFFLVSDLNLSPVRTNGIKINKSEVQQILCMTSSNLISLYMGCITFHFYTVYWGCENSSEQGLSCVCHRTKHNS